MKFTPEERERLCRILDRLPQESLRKLYIVLDSGLLERDDIKAESPILPEQEQKKMLFSVLESHDIDKNTFKVG